jgi:hypothetical protein
MNDQQKTRLRALIDLHNQFSGAYKSVEQVVEHMDFTTLNEVRYALRAIMDCIQSCIDADDDKFLESAAAAELALRIAWHDLVDITFDSFSIYLNELGKRFGPDIAAKHIDMRKCRKLLRLIEDLVKESRGDRQKRVELYKRITANHLDELVALFRSAQDSEAAIAAERKKEILRHAIMVFGAILATITLAIVLYVNFIRPPQDIPETPSALSQQ